MAISVQFSAQDFAGNSSTSTAYPVGFPVDVAGDVWTAVMPDGEENFTTLDRSEFTVTDLGSGAFEVRTGTAYPAEDTVKVFRLLDVTQPFEYPEGSNFPTREVERGLDRLLMLIQQVRLEAGLTGATITLPGGATAVRTIAIVADATERGALAPAYEGQPLIQLSPLPVTIWTGDSEAIGDWTQFAPVTVAPAMADKLTIGFVADCGLQGANQTALSAKLTAWAPDYVVFGGDNSYGGEAQFENDWAAFNSWVTAHTALPVVGNHDRDGASTTGLHYAKFTWLPGNRVDWDMVLGNGLVHVFVLDSGYNSAWALPSAGYNAVGSAQHTRFVTALRASTARWKLVFFHHPPISTEADAFTVADAMDWPEFGSVDGIFCGHTHLTEWLSLRGIPVVNVSGSVKVDGECSMAIQGAAAGVSNLLWANDRRKLAALLRVTPRDLVIELRDTDNGQVVYQRSLPDKTFNENEWGQEVIAPNVPIYVGWYFVGLAPAGFCVKDWFVGVAGTGGAVLEGIIWVDSVAAAFWTINAGDYWAIVTPVAKLNVRPGAFVQVQVTVNSSYPAWTGLQVNLRGRKVT